MYHLLEQNKIVSLSHLPKNSNLVNFSIFNDLTSPISFRSFAVKYVVEGTEKYNLNGNQYHLKSGQFLLANTYSSGKVEIDSDLPVKGLCIDLAPELMNEVLKVLVEPDHPLSDLNGNYFQNSNFPEGHYTAENTMLGGFLKLVGKMLNKNPNADPGFDREFYYSLTEHLLADQIKVFQNLYRLNTRKAQTRKDLFRKVNLAKSYMDEKYIDDISIPHIAAEISMSEYHFYRVFKTVYGVSPKQYIIRKRLSRAAGLLKHHKYSITEVAYLSGFSDVQALNVSCKKHFGRSPSELAMKN